MSLVGRNFFETIVHGAALGPLSLNNSVGTGATIATPWKIGRQISFLLVGGDFAAGGALTVEVEVQQISDDAWVNQPEGDGTTDLEFTLAEIADTGTLEDGTLLGTIDLSDIDGNTYKAIRLLVTETATQAVVVGAAYIISDLYKHPSTTVDDLFSKTQPVVA